MRWLAAATATLVVVLAVSTFARLREDASTSALRATADKTSRQANVGAAFFIRTPEGAARLTAPRMDAVDFITYRDDLKGSVSCGALAEPARVYATWRHAADGARTVIAIEFLPN